MRMPELKSLTRELRLRNYSRMRKAELVALLQNNPPLAPRTRPSSPTRPPPPPPPTQTWEPIDDRKPRKPSPQEMDIFEQQEMSKSRPQVKGKLNKWYDWLINHVPTLLRRGRSIQPSILEASLSRSNRRAEPRRGEPEPVGRGETTSASNMSVLLLLQMLR